MLLLARIVAALISGALLAQAHGLQPFWPLAWAAPIPLLIAVIAASRATAFLCGAIAGALSVAGMFAYMLDLAGPAPLAAIVVVKALIWGGAALAVAFAERRLPAAAAVFVFPALMAGVETLLAAVSPHGTAGAFAYSQMDFLPAIQVAALGGAPAITFVVMLFASLVAMLVARRAFVAALAPLALIGASLGFGYWRLSLPPAEQTVRVALLASDRFEGVPDDWRTVWAAYAPQIERAVDQDYRIVLMPEKIARLNADERELAVEQLAEIARRRDVHLIFGVDAETEEGRFNRAYIAPSGLPIASYDKHHMIPGLESHFTPGRARLQSGEPPARFGYAICKDMDFPAAGRALAGSSIVFVPAWDFRVDAWLHSRMAMLRGVENGYAVVRSARGRADGERRLWPRLGRGAERAAGRVQRGGAPRRAGRDALCALGRSVWVDVSRRQLAAGRLDVLAQAERLETTLPGRMPGESRAAIRDPGAAVRWPLGPGSSPALAGVRPGSVGGRRGSVDGMRKRGLIGRGH